MSRKNTFLICSSSFCSTDPLFLLKIPLGKGTPNSASLWIIFLTIPTQQVFHFLSTASDDIEFLVLLGRSLLPDLFTNCKRSFWLLYTSRSVLLNRYCLMKTRRTSNTTCHTLLNLFTYPNTCVISVCSGSSKSGSWVVPI